MARRRKELSGFTMREVIERTDVPLTSIYGWFKAGLLPSPASRGRGARYDEGFVERVIAIRELRRQNWKLDWIKEKLDEDDQKKTAAAKAAATTGAAAPREQWERIVLLPGLEVSYRADAGSVLRRLAEEIWRQFGGGVTPS